RGCTIVVLVGVYDAAGLRIRVRYLYRPFCGLYDGLVRRGDRHVDVTVGEVDEPLGPAVIGLPGGFSSGNVVDRCLVVLGTVRAAGADRDDGQRRGRPGDEAI